MPTEKCVLSSQGLSFCLSALRLETYQGEDVSIRACSIAEEASLGD